MATVIINGVSYPDPPYVEIPKQGGGKQNFYDTTDATLDNGAKMLPGNTAYANGVKYSGSMATKAAATYMPTTSDQTIAANQYLTGVQTVKGDPNLSPGNIKAGVTIFSTTGTLTSATITQDGTTKVLSIS